MSPPRRSPSVVVVVVSLLAATGCASSRSATGTPSPTASPRDAPSSSALARARGEVAKLDADLDTFETRLEPALSAVNFTLVRHPSCIDALFERYARMDLTRREIAIEGQDLALALEDAEQGRGDVTTLVTIENRAQLLRDRLLRMNAELALLFADAMSQNPTCAVDERAAARPSQTAPLASITP